MAIRKMLMNVGLGGAVLLLATFHGLYAQEGPKFVMTPPEEKRIIIEEVYPFTARQYDSPVEVQLLSSPDETSFATPEDVLIAHLSAALKGDFTWMASLETESERKKREALSDEARAKAQSELKTQVDLLLRNNRIVFMKRFEVGDVVIIEFSVFSRESGERVLTLPAVFILERGQWKKGGLPHIHPLLVNLNYRFPGREKRVPPTSDQERRRTISTGKPRPPFFIFSKEKEAGGVDQ